MEQLVYDTTVNDSFFTIEPTRPELNIADVHNLLQHLASTIDIHQLASFYFQHLQNTLDISTLKLQFETGSLTLGSADNVSNIKLLDCTHQQDVYATLHYGFSRRLSLRESNLLRDFHRYFTSPLKNALEFQAMKKMAMKDHLTGLGNRASYHETIQRHISQAKRYDSPFGLLVIDLDKFKQVNDVYGHHEGDKVLIAVSEVLADTLRDTDYAFRFGGDEFCCLLAESTPDNNQRVAQRIKEAIAKKPLLVKHGISCSIGGAYFAPEDSEQTLFTRADTALYQAKTAGRDCFIAA